MKVIKRDGRAVDYDKSKIMTAIEKANQEIDNYVRDYEQNNDKVKLKIDHIKRTSRNS